MSYRDLDPAAAQAALQADPTLCILDVRTPPEHASHRLKGATLVPLHELGDRLHELDPQANWLVHCEHGVRSMHACDFLVRQGFRSVTNLRGGIAHWMGSGLPIER